MKVEIIATGAHDGPNGIYYVTFFIRPIGNADISTINLVCSKAWMANWVAWGGIVPYQTYGVRVYPKTKKAFPDFWYASTWAVTLPDDVLYDLRVLLADSDTVKRLLGGVFD